MKHFVLFKFLPGQLTDEVRQLFAGAYAEMEEKVHGIQKAAVHFNCVQRDANMDVMVELDLENEAALPAYLEHPLHVALGQKTRHLLESFVSFDHCD